jgi:hypothetical protein
MEVKVRWVADKGGIEERRGEVRGRRRRRKDRRKGGYLRVIFPGTYPAD